MECNYPLIIKESQIHGKGVFSTWIIPKGSIFTCDVLLIDKSINALNKYHYPWDSINNSICIGFGSYLNHSSDPNVKIYKVDRDKLTKTFIALRDIEQDEELTLYYGDTFTP